MTGLSINGQWAIWYATHLDVPLFPIWGVVDGVCECNRANCGKETGKHPIGHLVHNGASDATTDVEVLTAWWTRHPNANIGLAAGFVFDVLDLDYLDPFTQSTPADDPLEILANEGHQGVVDWLGNGELGPVSMTGRGRHVLVQPTGFRNKTGNRSNMPGHCDWRGIGGYMIAPPSMHASGHRYAWLDEFPITASIPEAPEALLDMLRATERAAGARDDVLAPVVHLDPRRGDGTRYGLAALHRACDTIAAAAEGTRNQTLYDEAYSIYRLVAGGELTITIVDDCLTAAGQHLGLSDREITRTLDSASDRGQQRPKAAA